MKSKATGIQLKDGELTWDLDLNIQRVDSKIVQGMTIGATLHQNQAAILMARPGEFKMNPKLGVALGDELLGEDLLSARHKIKEQFPTDGLTVKKLKLYKVDEFEIEAEYE